MSEELHNNNDRKDLWDEGEGRRLWGGGGKLVQACEQPRREGHTLQMSGELVGI